VNTGSFLRRLLGGKAEAVDRRTQLLVSVCGSLLASRGEYASTALARDALTAWQGLDERCQDEFFEVLARAYSPSPEAVGRAAAAYQADPRPTTCWRCRTPPSRRARSCSAASTWRRAAPPRWWRCAACC
jgi:hypothetical protein